MSKEKKLYEKTKQKAYSTKFLFIKFAKRYGMILLISLPAIFILNFLLNKMVTWYTGAVAFFCSLAMVLFAFLIGIIIYSKIDEHNNGYYDPEKERDPFAD